MYQWIKAFHVKDAEFNPSGRQGVYSGFQPWVDRAGRFRSLGDGQVDFGGVFSKMAQYGYDSWAVLEWECCLKHPEDGAREGSEFIRNHIIRVTEKSFDDFVAAGGDRDIMLAAFGVKPEYLEASFDEMQKQYGTIEKYFSDGLGIDAAGQKALRDLYLKRM